MLKIDSLFGADISVVCRQHSLLPVHFNSLLGKFICHRCCSLFVDELHANEGVWLMSFHFYQEQSTVGKYVFLSL